VAKQTQPQPFDFKAFYREWFASRPKPAAGQPEVPLTGFKHLWHSWIFPLLWALLVVKLLINPFLLEAYRVPSGSMEKTILPGEWMMADKMSYGLNIPFTDKALFRITSPRPGQIVIFKSPYDGITLVKRCVARGGDIVEVRHKKLLINGKEMVEPYVQHVDDVEIKPPGIEIDPRQFQYYWQSGQLTQENWIRDNFGPVTVPPDCFFMMGDNRDNSFDSRFWGPLPHNRVRGRPLITYWSWAVDGDQPWYLFWQRLRLQRLGRIMFLK
jgi:signal peptidase I